MIAFDASSARPSRRTVLRGVSALAGALLAPGGFARAAEAEPPERPTGLTLSALELTGLGEPALAALGMERHAVTQLECPTGRIVVCDPGTDFLQARPLVRAVPVGSYPVFAYADPADADPSRRAGLLELRLSEAPVARWSLARLRPPSGGSAPDDWGFANNFFVAAIYDAAAADAYGFVDFLGGLAGGTPDPYLALLQATQDLDLAREFRFDFAPKVNLALVHATHRVGIRIASYWGLDAEGNPARLVVDLGASEGPAANRRRHAGAEPGVPTGPTLAALRRTDLSDADLGAEGIERRQVSQLRCPTGRIVACDPLVGLGDHRPFARSVPPGRHPVRVYVDLDNDWGRRVGLSELRLSDAPVARWRIALADESMMPQMVGDMISGYGVDAGTGCFCDEAAQKAYAAQEDVRMNAGEDSYGETALLDAALEMDLAADHVLAFASDLNVALFNSGFGDGFYASYWGFDEKGEPARLVTSFGVFEEAESPLASIDKERKR